MNWIDPPQVSIDNAFREAVGGHPLAAEILMRRGIDQPDEARAFLDPAYYSPSPPTALPDLEFAANRLLESIERGEQILVWGDFDVDGQTSTALLVDGLRNLGARVSYHVPHRMKHGHGIAIDVLESYLKQDIDLILTCDTGVSEHEAVDKVIGAGRTILITDHHALPKTLPDAPAVVNPQRLPADHPLRDLPGVGVAYKLIEQVYRITGREDGERQFLDLAALGIVADVANQRGDTRYLLQLGIDALRYPTRTGLQALMQAAQVDPSNLSSDTIGFQIGPRLNALGRLDDASLAVELLTTSDMSLARQIATQLELLNNKRKQIEDQIYAAAQDQIARDPSLLDFDALVLAGDHWHPGVIGIVASRLVDKYERPVLLLSSPPDDPIARGSARSVPGVNIGVCIAANDDLLIGHGGHPGAAGCSLDADLIPQFRRRLSNTIRETWDHSVVQGIAVDACLPLAEVDMELAEELNRLAPFGEGNPAIRLRTDALHVVSTRDFGIGKKHRFVTVEDEAGNKVDITWWRGAEYPKPTGVIDLVYIPRINDYRGRRSLQLEWVDARPTPGIEIEVDLHHEVIDLRKTFDPAMLPGSGNWCVWVEGGESASLPFPAERVITRHEPAPCQHLVIWTTPPGPQELDQMLDLTGARRVSVISRQPVNGKADGFIKRLAGLIKYAIKAYGGRTSITQLASLTAQRESAVRLGLDWMVAKGQISLEWGDDGQIAIMKNGVAQKDLQESLYLSLQALLSETAAFRAYFQAADLKAFFDI
ncbi:MAG: single-stranded-DNA-specific exonuclease RecJ [Anaerolineae bacterium]|nr:single-stranded-DNA-specific exonuclease RecJ [Anaerolineae bacterium]